MISMRNAIPSLLLCTVFMLIFSSCKSKKHAAAPALPSDADTEFSAPSQLIIEYGLSKQMITDTVKRFLDVYSKEDFYIEEYGLIVRLNFPDRMDIDAMDTVLLIKMPVGVEIIKPSRLGKISAHGEADFVIRSDIFIRSNWELSSSSTLQYYEWTKKPKFSFGLTLPIESLTDFVITRYNDRLLQVIDASIAETFTLRQSVSDLKSNLTRPYQLNEGLPGWYRFDLQEIALSPLQSDAVQINGKVILSGVNTFSSFKPAVVPTKNLPPFARKYTTPDSSDIRILTTWNHASLEQQLNQAYAGMVLEERGKTLQLNRFTVDKAGHKMRVTCWVSGDFNGAIALEGLPAYDAAQKRIYIDEIDFSVDTKNVLLKAASWALTGRIKRALYDAGKIPVGEYLDDIQESMDRYLSAYSAENGIYVYAGLGSIGIEQIRLTDENLSATVRVKLKVSSYLYTLTFFKQ